MECNTKVYTLFSELSSLTMKSYPLGIDNPILVKGVRGSHKWAIYWRDDMTKIATFSNQHNAMMARQSIIESL
jgi:hypothetical protein